MSFAQCCHYAPPKCYDNRGKREQKFDMNVLCVVIMTLKNGGTKEKKDVIKFKVMKYEVINRLFFFILFFNFSVLLSF